MLIQAAGVRRPNVCTQPVGTASLHLGFENQSKHNVVNLMIRFHIQPQEGEELGARSVHDNHIDLTKYFSRVI